MTSNGYDGYQVWKGWENTQFGYFDNLAASYFRSEILKCGVPDLAGLNVLEIGFGNGVFAGWCKNQGATYVGTEVNPELIKRARQAGFSSHFADQPLRSIAPVEGFDLIVAWDVFEHFEIGALRALLLEAKAILRPAAVLLARMPSGDSPFALSIQHGDLTHRTTLGSSAVRQLAGEVDLEVVQLREPSFVFPGLKWQARARRSAIQLLRKIVFPILVKGFMGGGPIILTPNIVVVLRRYR